MPIDALQVVKELRNAFVRRDSHRHCGRGTLKIMGEREGEGAEKAVLVLEPRLSRQVLCSKDVVNTDYFAGALQQMSENGRSLSCVAGYFAVSPLFLEGADHRQARAAFTPHVDAICALMRGERARIERYFRKRSHRVWSALDFARTLVEICFALAIRQVVGVSLLHARKTIRARASVFYFHFHPQRHVALDRALRTMAAGMPGSVQAAADFVARRTVAESLIIMGLDPTIAAICGAIVNGGTDAFSRASNRYCPVSFVSRTCIRPFELDGCDINAGDVLYLSLVKGADAEGDNEGGDARRGGGGPPISFGAGLHVCVGKPVALAVFELAQAIHPVVVGSMGASGIKAAGDGAFLVFSHTAPPS